MVEHLPGGVGLADHLVDHRRPLGRREPTAAGGRGARRVGRRRQIGLVAAVAHQWSREVRLQRRQRRDQRGRVGPAARGPHVADLGVRGDGSFRSGQSGERVERPLLPRRRRARERRVALGQVPPPAGVARPVVEPRADPVRTARDHVSVPVAVDVADLDRRVVRRVGQPVARQAQRSRQLAPRLRGRRVVVGLQPVGVEGQHLVALVAVDVARPDRPPLAQLHARRRAAQRGQRRERVEMRLHVAARRRLVPVVPGLHPQPVARPREDLGSGLAIDVGGVQGLVVGRTAAEAVAASGAGRAARRERTVTGVVRRAADHDGTGMSANAPSWLVSRPP